MNIRNVTSGLSETQRFPVINSYLVNGQALVDVGPWTDIASKINIEDIESVFLTFPSQEHAICLERLDFKEDLTVYVQDKSQLKYGKEYEVIEVEGGDLIELAGHQFEVIEREGILPSLGLYSNSEDLLFSGHLTIDNPNLILDPQTKEDYLGTLEKIYGRTPGRILPAHGPELDLEEIKKFHAIAQEKEPELSEKPKYYDIRTFREFEHEWNRGFENPYRHYTEAQMLKYQLYNPFNSFREETSYLFKYLWAAFKNIILHTVGAVREENYLKEK